MRPSTLQDSYLWWMVSTVPEELPKGRTSVITERDPEFEAFHRHSNYAHLTRIIVYCLKFSRAVRTRLPGRKPAQLLTTSNTHSSYLLRAKIDLAESAILGWLQTCTFTRKIANLSSGRKLARSSTLRCLNPFLERIFPSTNKDSSEWTEDSIGADLPLFYYSIILPKGEFITKLILHCEHEQLLHAGCESILSSIRRRYWSFAARSTIGDVLRKCIWCNRAKPKDTNYLMGQLPTSRVRIQASFFYGCGLRRTVS